MSLRLSVVSTTATYQLARSVNPIGENSEVVTITLTTTGVQNGQAIPYTITGAGITSGDFVGSPSLTGNFIVQNNTAYFTLTTLADNTLEGPETFTVTLNDSGALITVNITDTSAVQPGETWTYRGVVTGATSMNCSIYFAGLYVVGDSNGNIFTSPTGVTWTDRGRPGTGSAVGVNEFASNGTTLFAGLANGTVSYTTDGINWTNIAGPSATAFGSVAITAFIWANNTFVIAGQGGATATSPDGITWTNRGMISVWASYTDRTVNDFAWTGTYIIAVGTWYSKARSTNGYSWSGDNYNLPGSGFSNISAVASNGAGTVVLAGQGSYTLYWSTDHGASWTWSTNSVGTLGSGGNLVCDYIAGKFIVGSNSGSLAYSSTGYSGWTTVSATATGHSTPILSCSGSAGGILITSATKVATSP